MDTTGGAGEPPDPISGSVGASMRRLTFVVWWSAIFHCVPNLLVIVEDLASNLASRRCGTSRTLWDRGDGADGCNPVDLYG